MQAFFTTNTNTNQTYLTTYNWDATYNQSNIQETLLGWNASSKGKGVVLQLRWEIRPWALMQEVANIYFRDDGGSIN